MLVKKPWKTLLISAAVPLAVGGLSGWITRGSRETFELLEKPPLSPPGWVFPVVWTVLFLLMGLASGLVILAGSPRADARRGLALYGVQLVVNFFWPIFFFNGGLYWFSFFWLLLLLGLIVAAAAGFSKVSPAVGALMAPYAVWVAFAGYLNFGIAWLN